MGGVETRPALVDAPQAQPKSFVGDDDRTEPEIGRPAVRRARDLVEELVVMTRIMMEECQGLGACLARHFECVVDGAVPPMRAVGELRLRELGVVNEEIDALRKLEDFIGHVVAVVQRLLMIADVRDR
jgi:hypothetical protein